MHRMVLVSLVGALIAAAPAQAQTQDVNRGDRVRITALGLPGRPTGTVLRAGMDTLVLRLRQGVRRLSWWDIRSLERSIARTRRPAIGWGVVIGGAIGVAYGIYTVATSPCADLGCEVTRPLLLTIGLAGGMVAGGGIGFVVGTLAPSDIWRAVPGYEPGRRLGLGFTIPLRRTRP